MTQRKIWNRQPDLPIATGARYPLSLSHKRLCSKCLDVEPEQGRRVCAKCERNQSWLKLWPGEILKIFERDKGICANCGLSTCALLDTARIEFMKGGSSARDRIVALYYQAGFRKEDLHKRMWTAVQKDRDKHISVENSITLCNPCVRYGKANRRRAAFVEGTIELFPDFEQGLEMDHGEGYTST